MISPFTGCPHAYGVVLDSVKLNNKYNKEEKALRIKLIGDGIQDLLVDNYRRLSFLVNISQYKSYSIYKVSRNGNVE